MFLKKFQRTVQRLVISRAYSGAVGVNVSTASEDEVRQFKSTIPKVIEHITDLYKDDLNLMDKFYQKMLKYNVGHGKNIRGLLVVTAYKALEKDLTEDKIKLANLMGCCMEMFTGFALLADDIVDESEYRRGKLCWSKLEGLNSVNHMIMIENTTYLALKEYFSQLEIYVPVTDLFHSMIFRTFLGQILETKCFKNGKPILEVFSRKRFDTMAIYKTGYATYYTPVVLAAHLAGVFNERIENHARLITEKLGPLYQAQNDFLDCYGNIKLAGKDSNDISMGKCSWLIVDALERASPDQKRTIEKYYGQPGSEPEKIIRDLYEEMDIRKRYWEYENSTLEAVRGLIRQLPDERERSALAKSWTL